MTSQPERTLAPDGARGLAVHQPERIPALDGVRGLAITLVVMMHSMFYGAPLPGGPDPRAFAYARHALLGWCGVDVFFVLSGFLITGILVKARGSEHYFRNFYIRRSLRIFPLYYAVIALLFYVLHRAPQPFAEQLPYLLYVQNFTMAGEATRDLARGVTWSLAIEEQFYLVWPTVVFLLGPRRLVPACVLLIAGAIATRFVLIANEVPDAYFLTPCRLDALVVGALLAVAPLPPKWLGYACALGGAGWLVGISYDVGQSIPHIPAFQGYGIVAALLFAVGVLIVARHPGWFSVACTNRVLTSIGRYSYCIYLVHFLVIDFVFWRLYGDRLQPANATQQWIVEHVPGTLILIGITAIYLAATWLVAFCSWHLFEKWFLKLKRHFPSAA